MTQITTVRKDANGTIVETTETIDLTQQNSAKLAMNGKGEFSYEIKVYEDSLEELEAKVRNLKMRMEGIIRG